MLIYSLGKTILSFETLFVLFIFAGQYKTDPRFSWIPVDLTGFLFAITVLFALLIVLCDYRFQIQKKSLVLIVISFAFVSYVTTSLLWSTGYLYATKKAFYIATLTFWSLVAPAIVIANDRQRINRFFFVLLLFACWVAFEAFLAFQESEGVGFVTALGTNYLGISRIISLGVIIATIYFMYLSDDFIKKLFFLLMLVVFMTLLMLIGGRAPFLVTFLAILVPFIIGVRISENHLLLIKRQLISLVVILVIILGIICYLFLTGELTTTLRRIIVLLNEPGGGRSASLRLEYYISSFELWLANPFFGYGIGSWPILMEMGDVRSYPHSLFFEIISELGIIGIMIFVSLITYAIRMLGSWSVIRNDPMRLLIAMLFVSALMNALISGDIPDNRFLFVTLGLMALPKQSIKKKKYV